MQDLIHFDHKVASLVEPYDVAMAYLNFAHELDTEGDPTIPAFKALHIFEEINDPIVIFRFNKGNIAFFAKMYF